MTNKNDNLTKSFTWKSTQEELPKVSCDCLVITKSGIMMSMSYSKRWKAFNADDHLPNANEKIEVSYWTLAEDLYVKEEETKEVDD